MVRVLVVNTGEEIDIQDPKITYVKQVADIGDVTKANTSYSWAMSFPKTPRNVNTFKGLGIVGDQSDLPYRETRVHVTDNGLPIVANGLLQVKETAKEYKAFIQDGIVDFFRDVSVDKVSDVIDLSDLTHQNTIENIIASFTQDTYRYIVASYNGPPLADVNGQTNLNPFAMIPSINVRYLFDKIMDYYGWTYSGNIDLADLWMTYPNATSFNTNPDIDPSADLQFLVKGYGGNNIVTTSGLRLIYQFSGLLDGSIVQTINLAGIPNASLQIQQPGNYRISFSISGTSSAIFGPFITTPIENVQVCLYVNGIQVTNPAICTPLGEDTIASYDIVAFQGTVIQIMSFLEFSNNNQQVTITDPGFFKIEKLGVQNIDFSEALIKMKVKDFFKEILTRQALTVFPDVDHRVLNFVNVDNRLAAPIYNWSNKYVRRVSEAYVYDSYARVNSLVHKYDQDDQDFNDGFLVVDNENLPIEKTLYKSITHSPLEEFVVYRGANGSEYFAPVFKMFEVETRTDPDTQDVLADYKPIKNRFYIFQDERREDRIFILGNPVDGFPVAKLQGNVFKDIVNTKYSDINQILDDTRIHIIEMALTKWDAATLDLSARYHFEQEAATYLLNRLTWKNEQLCTGEFIRLANPNPVISGNTPVLLKQLPLSFNSTNGITSITCNLLINTVRYHNGSGPDPVILDRVFGDPEGQNPFNGGNEYYKMGNGSIIRITESGTIIALQQC